MLIEGLQIHALSDTHTRHRHFTMPGGDILIHSGDATSQGRLSETIEFLNWFGDQDYAHRIFVPGNHDMIFEENPTLMAEECKNRGIILLNDSGCEVEGIKIWGSPIQPWFYDWAFNRRRTKEEADKFGGGFIKDHWDLIPADTEILVTHGPPKGILDYVPRPWGEMEHVGCDELLAKIYQTQVKLHIFGHIHYAAGYKYLDGRTFVNAASLSEAYTPTKGNPRRIVKDVTGEYFVDEPILE
jgi:Icc-related predicted phosphoesterase